MARCSRCAKSTGGFSIWAGEMLCPGCLESRIDQKRPIEGELWTVITVENRYYGENINTYPTWRAAWVAASRRPGWRHIQRIYP